MDDRPQWQGQRTELWLKDGMLCVEGEAAEGYSTYYALDPERPPLVLCSDGTVLELCYVPEESPPLNGEPHAPMGWVCTPRHYGGRFLGMMRHRAAYVPVKQVVAKKNERTGDVSTVERLVYPPADGVLLETGLGWITLVYQWTSVWDRQVVLKAHKAALARHYGLDEDDDDDPGW